MGLTVCLLKDTELIRGINPPWFTNTLARVPMAQSVNQPQLTPDIEQLFQFSGPGLELV